MAWSAQFQPHRLSRVLPTIVSKRLVGFGHAMRVFALADRRAAIFRSFHEFRGETVRHRLLAAIGGRFDDPTHREGLSAVGANFDGNLVGSAADAARFDFDDGLDVVKRLLQHIDRLAARPAGLVADAIDRSIDDLFGCGLLSALHDHVDEFGQHVVAEFGIGENRAMRGCCSAGHGLLYSLDHFLGRLAPYFERPWRRSLTPAQSRAPRTVW